MSMDRLLVACVPVKRRPLLESEMPDGQFTRAACPSCGQEVWHGPRARILIEAGEAQFACDECIPGMPNGQAMLENAHKNPALHLAKVSAE